MSRQHCNTFFSDKVVAIIFYFGTQLFSIVYLLKTFYGHFLEKTYKYIFIRLFTALLIRCDHFYF